MHAHERVFDAIGTRWRVHTSRPLEPATADAVAARIAEFDRAYSRFRPDSLVAELAATGGPVAFPGDAEDILDLYDTLGRATRGAVDPLVGACLERLGYDPDLTLRPHGPPLPAPAPGTLRRAGTVLTAEPGAVLDIGALGKGYLVDAVTALLREDGHDDLCVDAGGDMRAVGSPLRVALEHPHRPDLAIGRVRLHDRALAASGTDRRAWGEGLHHVLDARTGAPVERVVATWALADTAALADGLATALFFVGPDDLAAAAPGGFGYVRVFSDGTAHHSPHWEMFA
ncbi:MULTISPECIES: FAD:protein FMN transferase [unclassified Nocardiopsis]|uniref:FAD:protein FMN transferase n=1 Tax=Nocardiopsis TaxID=2013 RepID=UPI00387AB29E